MHFTSGGSIVGIQGCGMVHGFGMPGAVGQPSLQAFQESVFETGGPFVAGRRIGTIQGARPTLNGAVPVGGSWGEHTGRVFGTGSVMGWR